MGKQVQSIVVSSIEKEPLTTMEKGSQLYATIRLENFEWFLSFTRRYISIPRIIAHKSSKIDIKLLHNKTTNQVRSMRRKIDQRSRGRIGPLSGYSKNIYTLRRQEPLRHHIKKIERTPQTI